jgi:hypothetical protein
VCQKAQRDMVALICFSSDQSAQPVCTNMIIGEVVTSSRCLIRSFEAIVIEGKLFEQSELA